MYTRAMSPPNLAELKRTLAANNELDVRDENDHLRVDRTRSFLPRRGLFRILIPRVTSMVRVTAAGTAVTTRPDAVALVMIVMFAGAVLVELVMDRVRYPREYPPAAVFGIAGAYLALLVVEWRSMSNLLKRALRH